MTVGTLLQAEADVPLIVDLDGALLGSDFALEAFFQLLGSDPRVLISIPGWLAAGRGRLKEELAARAKFDPELLPYDHRLLAFLRKRHAGGRRLVLISSASQHIVDRIAEELGIFAEAHGSSRDRNFTTAAKASFLVDRFGERKFDYVGSSRPSRPTAVKARQVITVDMPASADARSVVDAGANEPGLPDRPRERSRLRGYLAAMRPEQWVKNLLVFVPLFAAQQFDAPTVAASLLAFAAFCLTASSAYILNDLVDLAHDRKHLRKRTRPFASGRVPVLHGVTLMLALLATAVGIAASFLSPPFLLVLVLYYFGTLIYSLRLKRVLALDIITLAGLYTIRVIAGNTATGIEPSPWLLAFSMFLFLALAAVKRQSELMDLAKQERVRKAAGRGYVVDDLPMIESFGTAAGYISVLVFALYISSPEISDLYKHANLLWGGCPLLLYWISRMLIKAHRGEMHHDPIVYAFRDRVSLVIAAAMAVVIAAATTRWPLSAIAPW